MKNYLEKYLLVKRCPDNHFSARHLNTCAMSALALCTFAATPAHSDVQIDPQQSADIPSVIISGTRTEQSSLNTPASITVISREQIERSGATNVVDVLRGQGGIQINDLYGDGSRSSLGMRGFAESAGSNTLVLVDGRRLNNPDIAAPDLNSIVLEDVERIELVQGSAGVLFGDQAVGGVINIITRKPAAGRHTIKLTAGSYNRQGIYGSTSRMLDNGFNYRVSLDASQADNYRDHNESSYLNGFGKFGYDYDSGSVFAELQYIDDELETPGTLFDDERHADRTQVNANFATDFSNLETTVARLGIDQAITNDWSFEGELTSRDSDGVFRLSSVFGAETENATQDRTINEFTPRLIGRLSALNDTMVTIGADIVDSDYQLSSRFGDQFNEQKQRSLYLLAVLPVSESLDVTLGVRYAEIDNDIRDSGSFAYYPAGSEVDDDLTTANFGLSYRASDSLRLLFHADQNYRFAKVDELLQPALNPDFTPALLDTQTGLSLETGVEWQHRGNTAKFLVYQLDLENEIAFDPVNFANINLDETERSGIITSAHWQMSERAGLSASYSYTDAKVSGGAFDGKDIPFVAEHTGRVQADYVIDAAWQVYSEVVATSDRVFSGDFDNVLDRLPGYAVVNIKARYQRGDFTLTGRINNLLDKQYSDVGQLGTDPNTFAPRAAYFPSPEINVLLTAAWQFQ